MTESRPPAEARGMLPAELPRRPPGVDLIGAADANAYAEEQWLICVDGTRYVQATRRLYQVLLHADGRTPVEEIARRVSRALGAEMSADQVRWLLRERLEPAGLVIYGEPAEGAAGASRRRHEGARPRTPLLGIKHRLPVLPYAATAPIVARLHHLYWPPLVALVVVAAAAVNAWLYLFSGLHGAISTLFSQPELILVLLALDVPLRLFHELGHASAMRRAGAPYGEIGVALYVAVPVYYTDVTHAYRLPRLDRVRVDLGGMYFDLISTLVLFAAYRFSGQPVLLLAMVLIGLNMLREFTPFMRFDGYYLMADLVGLADPMSHLRRVAADLLPGRHARGKKEFTRPARLALTAYLLVVVAFLLRPLLLLAFVGRAAAIQAVETGSLLWAQTVAAWRAGDAVQLAAGVLELAFWSLIPIGLGLFSVALARLAWRGLARLSGALQRRRAPVAPAAPASRVVVAEAAGLKGDAIISAGTGAQPVANGHRPAAAEDDEPAVITLSLSEEAAPDASGPETTAPLVAPEEPAVAAARPLEPEPAGAGRDELLEETLLRASSRHLDELRELGAELHRLYEQELQVKDRLIEELRLRVGEAERDRDTLAAGVRRLEAAFEQHVASLDSLGDDFQRRATMARREFEATLALIRAPEST